MHWPQSLLSGDKIKNRLGYDDSLDAFGVPRRRRNCRSSLADLLYTSELDGEHGRCGQEEAGLYCSSSEFRLPLFWSPSGIRPVATYLIILLVDKTIGLRTPEKDEMAGLDSTYHGEDGYGMLNAS